MNRRRRIKRRSAVYRGRKIQVNFVPVIVIIGLAICAGYLTAKYVVYPILGYEPASLSIFQEKGSETAVEESSKTSEKAAETEGGTETESAESSEKTVQTAVSAGVLEEQAELKKTSGYAIQFGSYSTKAAAENSVAQLKQSGVAAEIVEKDGAYKVISRLFNTKEKAKTELNGMDASLGAFVTEIEE